MSRIPSPERPDRVLASIVRKVAFERRLSWRMEELRVEAANAYDAAEPLSPSLGLPPEQVSKAMLRKIYEQIDEAAGRMDPLPHDQTKPTPEQIATALEWFTTRQWIGLIDGLDPSGTRALLSFVRHNSGELKQRLGARRIERIEGRAIMRDTDLWLVEHRDELVPVSDVFWSVAFRDMAREANRRGKGHPAKGRSVAEQSSDRSIAERLTKRDEQTGREMKVSRHQIKEWRARMEELPYEQYAAEVGAESEEERAAAYLDYLTMIRADHRRQW